MSGKNYTISLPATRESLLRVYEFLSAVSTAFGLDTKTHFDLELATEEAITNIISHAYNEDPNGKYVLSVSLEDKQAVIQLQDWGKPFDPAQIPPFDYSEPVEKRINGGMGVHFMRTLMDDIRYRFDDNEGTILTMIKNLSTSPGDQIEEELQVFEEVGLALSNERNVETLLPLIVDKLTEVVDADRGTLYLIDEEKDELVSKILQDDTGRLTEIRLKIGEGVSGYVAQTGETVNIFSAKEDPHFARWIDQSSGYETKTMLCTPMRNAQREIIGVVQLLNKIDGVFTPRDEAILTVLSSQAAIAIENAQLITSEKTKRQLADTLREVSSIINSALELDAVLKLILNQLERVISFEGVSIMLIEGEDLVVKAAYGYVEDIVGMRLFKTDDNLLFQEMSQTRQPIIIPDVNQDSRWIKISQTQGVSSWLGAPLIVQDRVIGEMSITISLPDFYRHEHGEVAQTFANQAAAAIERARLHQQTIRQARLKQELETAYSIQSSLLPEKAPQITGWDIASSWKPAQEVAGDFFDFFELPNNRLGFVIADVCGKGIPAALFMSLSRTIFRVLALTDMHPLDELLAKVNNQIKSDNRANLFVTLFYGVLDVETGELHYCNGGHNPPIFVRKSSGEDSMIDAGGPALGIFPDVGYKANTLQFEPGDMFVAYTDGLPEAINENDEEYGEERLIECVKSHQDTPAEELTYILASEIARFTNNSPPADDATAIVIRRLQT
jgi:serine phosphatase RsbU (regulator of sigma subunit)/anti-sigma regulatory factor (Ser/Thr protein kinase)